MKRIVGIAAGMLLMAGCVSTPKTLTRPAFPITEYTALETEGSAVVTGQVIMRTNLGPRFGGGEEVWLNPVTSYSTFWYINSYHGNKDLADADYRQDHYIITTNADGDGRFRFDNVPPGEYYLASSVRWAEPGQYVGQTYTYNEMIVDKITVGPSGQVNKILTREM